MLVLNLSFIWQSLASQPAFSFKNVSDGETGHQVQWGAFPSICFVALSHIEFFVYVKLTLAFRILFCLLERSGNENMVSGLQ